MKLTVAMGLQYDNGRSGNLYALRLGRADNTSGSLQQKPPTGVAGKSDQSASMVAAVQHDLLVMAYNLKGLPVAMIQDVSRINLFA